MTPLLDLTGLTAAFIRNRLGDFDDDNRLDLKMLGTLSDKTRPATERLAVIAEWITFYKIHRIKGSTAASLAKVLIEYADGRDVNLGLVSSDILKEEFNKLQSRYQASIGSVSACGELRSVQSLTSKSIWCCYPESAPVLDKFAESALRMLCRLRGGSYQQTEDRYGDFLEAWFVLYGEIEPTIPVTVLKSYPYKVRIFDHMLWWLGQDKYPSEVAGLISD